MDLNEILMRWGYPLIVAVAAFFTLQERTRMRLNSIEKNLEDHKMDNSKEFAKRVHLDQCVGHVNLVEEKLKNILAIIEKVERKVDRG